MVAPGHLCDWDAVQRWARLEVGASPHERGSEGGGEVKRTRKKPSRPVTRVRCLACARKFIARRSDAVACSARCRQRVHRARQENATEDIDAAIQEARIRYWSLIKAKAMAMGLSASQVVTAEAATVHEDGSVFIRGRKVGTTKPPAKGWTVWGLEAAGPPFNPPPGAVR